MDTQCSQFQGIVIARLSTSRQRACATMPCRRLSTRPLNLDHSHNDVDLTPKPRVQPLEHIACHSEREGQSS